MPPLSDPALSLRFGLSYGAIFFVLGVLGPFLSLFLSHQGFDAATIGALLAIGGPVRVIAGPLMGWVADSGVPLRRLLGLANIIAGLAVIAMVVTTQVSVMAVLMAVLYAAHGPLSAMVDAALSQALLERRALNYARIRLWGSFGFIAGNLIGGRVADIAAPGILLLAAAGLAAGALTALALPHAPGGRGPRGVMAVAAMVPARWGCIGVLILAAACVQASHVAIYTISALAWRAQGLSQSMTGILWTLGVITEVILFFRIGRALSGLRRAYGFLLLGGGVALVRWLVMATEPDLAVTMLCQLAHGLTFGATHLGTIAALAILSPDAYRSRIQGLVAGTQAIGSSLGIYLTGQLYQTGGAPQAYRLMALSAGVGVLLAAGLALHHQLRGGRDG